MLRPCSAQCQTGRALSFAFAVYVLFIFSAVYLTQFHCPV